MNSEMINTRNVRIASQSSTSSAAATDSEYGPAISFSARVMPCAEPLPSCIISKRHEKPNNQRNTQHKGDEAAAAANNDFLLLPLLNERMQARLFHLLASCSSCPTHNTHTHRIGGETQQQNEEERKKRAVMKPEKREEKNTRVKEERKERTQSQSGSGGSSLVLSIPCSVREPAAIASHAQAQRRA